MEEDISTLIERDLRIPKCLIHIQNHNEAVALVSHDWIFNVSKNKVIEECIVDPALSEHILSTELHHSTYTGDGYCKIFISRVRLNSNESKFSCTSSSARQMKLSSFGQLQKLLAHENFKLHWAKCCKTHKDCYIVENFDSVDNASIGDTCRSLHEKHSETDTESEYYALQNDSNSIAAMNVNCLPVIAAIETNGMKYVIKPCIIHSVHDALMYSPSMLSTSNSKPLFLLYQLLSMMNYVQSTAVIDLSDLTWKLIALDKLMWTQADIHEHRAIDQANGKSQLPLELSPGDEEESDSCWIINELTDKWVCGQLSNYDYLMHLNKLAGRRLNDPHHHPILPWISDLSSFNGGWRDLTKSKYRLNKGDDQLELQYAMAAENVHASVQQGHNAHVPHHVPDMLSDITYYVYKARNIPKEILQKHVRSYWEPNEYPASIQRIQEWTPDECIPEFYTDASIFSSHHDDMGDLTIPDWCNSSEDFIVKHKAMLESLYVSKHLHEWIDITFGYKLSGKHAVQAMNVCRHLVDQHTNPLTQGIVQIFRHPHPQRRTYSPSVDILLSPLLNANASGSSYGEISKLEAATDALALQDENGLGSSVDPVKPEDFSIQEESVVRVDQQIRLPDGYDPFIALNELEKLLMFKACETNRVDLTFQLKETLQNEHNKVMFCTAEEMISDRNMLVFVCLTVELFLAPQMHPVGVGLPLSARFEAAALCYNSNKLSLPTTVRNALQYLFKCLVDPVESTCSQLSTYEVSLKNEESPLRKRIFKNSSSYPPPRPLHLLSEPMQILYFPTYFKRLYQFLEHLVELTDHYQDHLDEEDFVSIEEELVDLLACLHGHKEGIQILLPHIIEILEQPFPYSAKFLVLVFDHISQELGPEESSSKLLPAVVRIYNDVNSSYATNAYDVDATNDAASNLYDKSFLIQTYVRFGFKVFLENFPRLIAECLIRDAEATVVLVSSMKWMMVRFGPTLTSKYIIRHLLHIVNSCYNESNHKENDVCKTTDRHVINCLIFAASMYGSSFLTLQYIPHISFTVSSAISGTCFNDRSYAAIEAATALLVSIVPYLTDQILMEQLNRLSKEIIMPLIGILSSQRIRFPSGGGQRKALCLKTITLLVSIAIRIGREMSRQHLTGILQSFFSNYTPQSIDIPLSDEDISSSGEEEFEFKEGFVMPRSLEAEHDTIAEAVRLDWLEDNDINNAQISQANEDQVEAQAISSPRLDPKYIKAVREELVEAFCPETAFHAYVPFTRLMGTYHMERILENNLDVIWRLSSRYESALAGQSENSSNSVFNDGNDLNANVSVVGNRIMVADKSDSNENLSTIEEKQRKDLRGNEDFHLKGNLLAYWEHEIGLASNDGHIHFNQIDLQTFSGHTAAVKCMHVNDSEEWFMSGSKDKTVKIWSLRGGVHDGNQPLFVYRAHKKAVLYTSLIKADGTVVSCDGSIHVWDPYSGQQICNFDSSEFKANIVSLTTLPAPQRLLLAATSDTNLKMIDIRQQVLAQEYKASVGSSAGIIRSISTLNNSAVVGFTSGILSLLDLRMGPILRMWQAHDSDVITSSRVTNNTFLTTSLDQTIAYWETSSINPLMVYRSLPEPAHIVRTFHSEIVSGSNSNRIIVHSLPPNAYGADTASVKASLDKPSLATKLRSDSLRGSLTTFSILPMKRQLLVSSDSGSIKLLA